VTRRHNDASGRGFTLVEVAIAIAIVAVGVTALMLGLASSTEINRTSRDLNQAVLLAQELREWTVKLPFFDPQLSDPGPLGPETGEAGIDDLDDLNGQTFSPPRDATGNQIADLPAWRQTVTMNWVDPTSLTTVSDTPTDVVSVRVVISNGNEDLLTTGWLVTRRN